MDQQPHMTITEIDLSLAPIVAQASGAARAKTNWTVLTIYGPTLLAGPRGPFIAEIVGETTQKGQTRRVRRVAFSTLARALSWNMFDRQSGLFEELRQKAIAWLESQPRGEALAEDHRILDARTFFVPDMGLGSREQSYRPPVQRSGFDGKDGLLGAVLWLYEGVTPDGDENAAFAAFAEDFGIELSVSIGAGLQDRMLGPGELGPGWHAFIASLAFFDREAFHANRSKPDA